jgi:hypothetical protein
MGLSKIQRPPSGLITLNREIDCGKSLPLAFDSKPLTLNLSTLCDT